MPHVVLLGDSIFDNAAYVPGRPPVIHQVQAGLPQGWRATLLAIDGHMVSDVPGQLTNLPADASHLFVSAGGNDALGESGLLRERVGSVAEAITLFSEVQARFRNDYHAMLRAVRATGLPVAVCTIYDASPVLGAAERTGLAVFNDVILRSAFLAGWPVIDLRLLCDRPEDYSHVSPIEPSADGGAKIARVITEMATGHDFTRRRSVVYS
jgi:hypothetical protein